MKTLKILITLVLMGSLLKGSIAQYTPSTVLIKVQDSLYVGIPIEQWFLIPKVTEAFKSYEALYINEYELNKYKDQMIIAYSDILGVQAGSIEDLRTLAANKRAIEAAKIQDLQNTIDEGNKALKKANRKKVKGTVIGTLIGIGAGFVTASFIK